jgi:SulP family sulfate permease
LGVLPAWVRTYRRDWLRADLVAGLIVWSVVTPQAVAYAQIAGLPPEAGLIAAPGALLGYALLGSSHTLVVSATTATSALSAAAVGPLADGDVTRFAVLSAALALVSAAVLGVAGVLRFGGITEFVSKPVITGFLFGLGLFIMISQAPSLFGVEGGSGEFFGRVADLLGDLGETHGWTIAVGGASIVALVVLRRAAPTLPGTLVVLIGAIVVSALLDLDGRGVSVVGELPEALPDPALPDVGWADVAHLIPPAFGIMIVSAEAVGVARALATKDGYQVDVNRELYAMGAANALAGLSSGFVQSGGASQTAAAENAGGKTQLASVIAGVLILLTGAFLTGLLADLPQATLAAIVIVAVASFLDVGELRRIASIRRTALLQALVALAGVLLLGVLPGLLVAAALSLVILIHRLSRPPVERLEAPAGVLAVRVAGPLIYANATSVKDHLLELVRSAEPPPETVVIQLYQGDVDVESLDMLAELNDALAAEGVELRLTRVRPAVLRLLRRSGLAERVQIEPAERRVD